MKKKTETFADLIERFRYHFDTRTVFDDFLTLTLTCFCLDVKTGLSYDEPLYLETIGKYAKHDLRHIFPQMLATLITEMERRSGSASGNDVLGEYYEAHLARNGLSQYFTPWPICEMIARSVTSGHTEESRVQRILDPCCGSGRMILAGSRVLGPNNEYYAIDVDATCIKMTALNLFLNGVFKGEVLCADALNPDSFTVSYKLSLLPFGVFRITEKERSLLFKMHRNAFMGKPGKPDNPQLSFF